MNILTVN